MNILCNICFLPIQTTMITYKACCGYWYEKDIVDLFKMLESNYTNMNKDKVSKRLRRSYYIKDFVVFTILMKLFIPADRLIEKIHKVFGPNFVVLVTTSAVNICFTAFIISITISNNVMAIRFVSLVTAVFLELFLWCWAGNGTSNLVNFLTILMIFSY